MTSSDDDVFQQAGDLAVNLLTGGLTTGGAGVAGAQGGSVGKGAATTGVDESLGEVTGRNVQRKAAMTAADAIDEENKRIAQEKIDEQLLAQRTDLEASNAAGSKITASSQRAAAAALGAASVNQDFLGL